MRSCFLGFPILFYSQVSALKDKESVWAFGDKQLKLEDPQK